MRGLKVNAFLLATAIMLLSGCGEEKVPDTIGESSVLLQKNGSIGRIIVEDFDKDYYDVDELSREAASEIDAFNGQQEPMAELVGVARCGENNENVSVEYKFTSYEGYDTFCDSDLFYGTVKRAKELKLRIPGGLIKVKDGSTLAEIEISSMENKMYLVTDEKTVFYSTQKPLAASVPLNVDKDGRIDLSGTEGTIYILFE